MSGASSDFESSQTVSANNKGDFGIIKVRTFLVPSITLKQVINARNKVKNAKYLIYDLRENGGGSASSNSYLIETILGPNKTIQFSRTRSGMERLNPVFRDNYFNDEINHGSQSDIEFENANHYVEWKTRREAIKDFRQTFIIVNKKCASSCDVFSAAIKEHKAATILGTKTAGAVLGAITYKLNWPGYSAIMPTSQLISAKGILYEGIGIEPDHEIKTCEDPGDTCINDSITFIKKYLIKP